MTEGGMRKPSRNRVFALIVAVACVSVVTALILSRSALSDGPGSPPYVSGGLLTRFIDKDGTVYSMEGSSFRADVLDLSMFTPIGGPMLGASKSRLLIADETYAIEGIAGGEWVAGRSVEEYNAWRTAAACWNNDFVLTFTVEGVAPYPRPLSRSTPVPDAGPNGPTPTPTSTAIPGPGAGAAIELTEAGLLAGGWPYMDWGREPLVYEGKRYRSTGGWPVDDGTVDMVFPNVRLVEDAVIEVGHELQLELSPDLARFLATNAVTDHVRVYRPADGPESKDVIVLDPCPRDLRPDVYVFFKKVNPAR
jgi:hypothetical protein